MLKKSLVVKATAKFTTETGEQVPQNQGLEHAQRSMGSMTEIQGDTLGRSHVR